MTPSLFTAPQTTRGQLAMATDALMAARPARRSHYQDSIAERLAVTGNLGIDPRHVEAFMRLEHPTLDGLSPRQFASEVDVSAECVQQAGAAESEALAVSFGL